VDISSDGGTIAFLGNTPTGGGNIYIHRLDRLESVRLEGTEFGLDLHLSPDGKEIIYGGFTGELLRLSVAGGRPRSIPGGVATSFLGWAPDGVIWYSNFNSGAMYRLPPGGEPGLAFSPESTGVGQVVLQQVLPGGRKALVSAFAATNQSPLLLLDLKSGERTPLPVGLAVEARYAQGLLILARGDGTLQALPFDPATGKTGGSGVQIGEDVSLTGTGVAQFAVAENGTVVYVPQQPRELVLIDRGGRAERVTEARRNYHSPRFSPDGRRIAVDFNTTEGRDTWILDRGQGTMTRATFERDGHDPVWLPGGRDLAFASSRGSGLGVFRTRPGATSRDSLIASERITYTGSWFPDGRRFLTVANEMQPGSGSDLVLVDSANVIHPYVVTPFNEGWPAVSPDGTWFAFASDLSGRLEVYIQPIAGDGGRIQVSLEGGSEPVWSSTGAELLYRSSRGGQVELVAAEIALVPEPHVASRRVLFPVDEYDAATPHANYDITADGRTFVMVRRSPATHLVVIQGLKELVRRLQGAGADGS
jgi:Tol biopolymer transport system component